MASARASVETVKSSVETVGRAVEDMQKNEAEGREELKRCVEEASSGIGQFLVLETCKCDFCTILSCRESRASKPCCFRSRT